MLFLILLFLLPALVCLLKTTATTTNAAGTQLPKSYPIIGSFLAFNRKGRLMFITDILRRSPTSTFVLHVPFSGSRHILTANPDVVRHILKDNFHNYQKGPAFRPVLEDLLGDGITNVDGAQWKLQRQMACHEFNTRSLRRFFEKVVDAEVSDRLIPLMAQAAADGAVLDLQDVLRRFAFDNICKIGFGYDPACLSLPLSDSSFAAAFDEAVSISGRRFRSLFPIQWKLKRLLGVGSESRLKEAVSVVRGFAIKIIRQKQQEIILSTKSLQEEEEDLLSRFLKLGHLDEQFVADIVISLILAGRDTTSSVLTWFFWLLSKNSHVEFELLEEIMATTCVNDTKCSESPQDGGFSPYKETKEMVYTHACLCEAMRLYPPIPANVKEAVQDDILPDGTRVRRGERVSYYAYAMGRHEKIWGEDWPKFRPERWLDRDEREGKWRFVGRDPYEYPVFQAGPRICLGKEMAFLQMKRVVARILKRFKVVPMLEFGVVPIFVFTVSSKMKGGLPVRFEERKVIIDWFVCVYLFSVWHMLCNGM